VTDRAVSMIELYLGSW